MTKPAVATHSPQHEELAALYALDVLEGDELADYMPHLAVCPTCTSLVAANRQVAQQLAVMAPASEVEPSAGFKERLLERARQEIGHAAVSAAAAHPAVQPRETDRARWWSPGWLLGGRRAWAVPTAVGALAAIVAALLFGLPAYENQVVATITLRGSADGSARVLIHRSGAANLELQGLAAPPEGQVYEAWVIGADGQPIPAGATDSGQGTLPLTARVTGNSVVAVTVEPYPGRPRPSGQPILAGRLEG